LDGESFQLLEGTNVPAGSHSSAYWLELRNQARGPHWDEYPDIDPKTTSLGLFSHNVAHSNDGDALKANGYTPNEQAVFHHFLSFLNKGMSFDFVESEHMSIEGGVFFDEVRGLELEAAFMHNFTVLQWNNPSCHPDLVEPANQTTNIYLRGSALPNSVFNSALLTSQRFWTNWSHFQSSKIKRHTAVATAIFQLFHS
jgi:hypothetical protein